MRGNVSNALWWALGAAALLFALSRTQRGQTAIAEATDSVISTVRGLRNNNPGNLRANQFTGSIGVDATGYARFDSMAHGIRGSAKQLQLYVGRGIDTVRKIVTTWAPATENNTAAYIAAVVQSIGRSADARLTLDELTHAKLMRAIFKHELGTLAASTITDAAILQGIRDI